MTKKTKKIKIIDELATAPTEKQLKYLTKLTKQQDWEKEIRYLPNGKKVYVYRKGKKMFQIIETDFFDEILTNLLKQERERVNKLADKALELIPKAKEQILKQERAKVLGEVKLKEKKSKKGCLYQEYEDGRVDGYNRASEDLEKLKEKLKGRSK